MNTIIFSYYTLHPTPYTLFFSPYTLHPLLFALSPIALLFLAVLFFVTSVVGVVTGSNSLIAVPAMFQFGIDPRVAVATNMFGLTFMAVGGTLPFLGKGRIDRKRLPALAALTLFGSILGALLVLVTSARAMPVIISVSMVAVAGFTLWRRKSGVIPSATAPTWGAQFWGYALTFLLGIYGGFFSGGYVTILTVVFVALFGMTFVEAVATTKIVNVFSSLVATIVFMARGLVDYRLGILLGLCMFVGAFVGARIALKLNNAWLRYIFLAVVVLLALKILLYDFFYRALMNS